MNLLRRLKKYTLYRKYKRDFWSDFFKKKKKDIASYIFLKVFSTNLQKKSLPIFKKFIFKLKRPVFSKNIFFFTKFFLLKKFIKRSFRFIKSLRLYSRFEWFSRYTWYIYYQINTISKLNTFKKQKGLKNKYDYLRAYFKSKINFNYHVNFFRIKPFNPIKARLAFWIKRRRLETFTSLFYGYTSLKKFKKAQDSLFFKTRSSNTGLFFENYLYIYLFRINIFREHYSIKTLIKKGFIEINGRVSLDAFFKFRLNDDISIRKKYFRKVYFLSKKNKKKLINFPEYIVFNPIILCGSIWRNPFKHEVCGFYDFRIRRNFFGKSSSSSYYPK